jgi:hypothetical protein
VPHQALIAAVVLMRVPDEGLDLVSLVQLVATLALTASGQLSDDGGTYVTETDVQASSVINAFIDNHFRVLDAAIQRAASSRALRPGSSAAAALSAAMREKEDASKGQNIANFALCDADAVNADTAASASAASLQVETAADVANGQEPEPVVTEGDEIDDSDEEGLSASSSRAGSIRHLDLNTKRLIDAVRVSSALRIWGIGVDAEANEFDFADEKAPKFAAAAAVEAAQASASFQVDRTVRLPRRCSARELALAMRGVEALDEAAKGKLTLKRRWRLLSQRKAPGGGGGVSP